MTKKRSSVIFTLKMEIFPEIGPRKFFLVPPNSAPGLRPCVSFWFKNIKIILKILIKLPSSSMHSSLKLNIHWLRKFCQVRRILRILLCLQYVTNSFALIHTTSYEIIELAKSPRYSRSEGPDGIDLLVGSRTIEQTAEIISEIINSSFETGLIPPDLK